MTKRSIAFLAATLASVPAWAVYAPIPEEELGQSLTVRVGGGVYHDNNIFGGATGETESMVYRFSPSLKFNASLTAQTFFSAAYDLNWDHVVDRPENQDLYNHRLSARLAHAFSQRSTFDFTNTYTIAENPESLLAGVPLNTDQSFKNNQADLVFKSGINERLGYTFKARSSIYAFDIATLSEQLDRSESLFGLSLDYSVSEASQLLGELRYLDVSYDSLGNTKDKHSYYYLAGFDYAPSEKVSISVRAGFEERYRSGAPDDDSPYAEITGRYAYGEKSFVSAGYIRTTEENSNVNLYTDIEVNRFFLTLQHAFTAQVTGSVFYNIEPSTLNGRAGIAPDADETTQRGGLALSYQPRRHWLVAATLDIDSTDSDDNNRDLDRTRIGLDVRYTF
ncbi:hypothetical protein [Actomonas aquatica]|uniref:Beta-barrel porin 2 n=1 Tax=Actomonas aquatica TaxID=2866162 RepID=A0ABZ1CBA5_9BACT|nr:hypothetical protein [Opitutus sp. WL0086]WRQ87585.1 hypothetical protein K1X11_022445 [Opitutus sp. WL0086]